MQTKKTKEEAKINWGWPANSSNKPSKKSSKKTQRNLKKVGFKAVLIALCLLVLSSALGLGVCYIITKDDHFTLLGQDELSLQVSEKYIEDGFEVIEFGKKQNHKVIIETDMVINEDGSYSPQVDENGEAIVGTYYILYKTESFKYSKIANIQRIRLITFVEDADDSLYGDEYD
ncbi:MAG: hypothetical protein IJX26_01480 [Clostridia bacterium]|nr:hypothetical protein [Clostridia bacterium]